MEANPGQCRIRLRVGIVVVCVLIVMASVLLGLLLAPGRVSGGGGGGTPTPSTTTTLTDGDDPSTDGDDPTSPSTDGDDPTSPSTDGDDPIVTVTPVTTVVPSAQFRFLVDMSGDSGPTVSTLQDEVLTLGSQLHSPLARYSLRLNGDKTKILIGDADYVTIFDAFDVLQPSVSIAHTLTYAKDACMSADGAYIFAIRQHGGGLSIIDVEAKQELQEMDFPYTPGYGEINFRPIHVFTDPNENMIYVYGYLYFGANTNIANVKKFSNNLGTLTLVSELTVTPDLLYSVGGNLILQCYGHAILSSDSTSLWYAYTKPMVTPYLGYYGTAITEIVLTSSLSRARAIPIVYTSSVRPEVFMAHHPSAQILYVQITSTWGTTIYTIDINTALPTPLIISSCTVPDVTDSRGIQIQGPYLITTCALPHQMMISEFSLTGVQPDVFRIPFGTYIKVLSLPSV